MKRITIAGLGRSSTSPRVFPRILFAVAALLAAGAAHAAPPTFSPYIVGVGREMHVYSNDDWSVNEGGPRAKETKPYVGSKAGSDPAFYVWRSQCRIGKQTVKFFRPVELPGAPGWLRFTLFGDRSTYKKVVLKFNGESVLLVPDYSKVAESSFDLDETARKKLREGWNEIEVVVTKKAGSASSCNGFTGVFIALDGTFLADVRVPGTIKGHHRRVSTARSRSKLVNVGPSKVYSATWELSLNAGFSLPGGKHEFEITGASVEGGTCEIKRPGDGSGKFRAICNVEDLSPGDVRKTDVRIKHTPDFLPFDYRNTSYGWRVTLGNDQARDPNSANDAGGSSVTFCDEPSSLPACYFDDD